MGGWLVNEKRKWHRGGMGADSRQSETTSLLHEHANLAPAMPAPTLGRRLSIQLIPKQRTARASIFLKSTWKNFHAGHAVAN
jgi:hypothetical protein